MKYILIADDPATLPFAVNIDADSADAAVAQIDSARGNSGYINCWFLVDLENKGISRLVRDGDEWALSDTAYDELGVNTTAEYFKEDAD